MRSSSPANVGNCVQTSASSVHQTGRPVRARGPGPNTRDAAVRSYGLSPDPALVRLSRHDEVDAAAAAFELLSLSSPPTAFFTANNRATVGVARALRTSRQPRAVVGFDDLDLADLVDAPLSVVAYDSHDLGHRAARLLLERIDGENGLPRRVVVPTMLVARGSGEIPFEGDWGRSPSEPALRRLAEGTPAGPDT